MYNSGGLLKLAGQNQTTTDLEISTINPEVLDVSVTLSEIFKRFAREEFHEASPLYGRLALGVARDADLLNLASDCRKGERIPNFLFAAVHYLLLSGVSHPLARFYGSLGGTMRDVMVITVRPHGGDDSELVLTTFVKGARTDAGLAYMQNHGNWIEWLGCQ